MQNFCGNTKIKLRIHVAFYNTSLENFESRDESGPVRAKEPPDQSSNVTRVRTQAGKEMDEAGIRDG